MKRAISILLAFLILTSSVGVTFATHLCGGKAVATLVSLGDLQPTCEMQSCLPEEDEDPEDFVLKNKPCCENNTLRVALEDEFNSSEIGSDLTEQQLVPVFVKASHIWISGQYATSNSHRNYHPPLVKQDIPILIRSLLI